MTDTESQPMIPPNIGTVQFGGMPGGVSDTIASMRWENDPLVQQLYKMLGCYDITIDPRTSQVVRSRTNSDSALVNDLGIDRIIAIIRGVVNPVMALSNIDEEEANELTRQILRSIRTSIVYNKERFGIHDGDLTTISNCVKPVVFAEIRRAIGGHESRNFRTQTFEQNLQQSQNMNNTGGFKLFGFGSKH